MKVVFRATPVTMPGSAIGRITRNEIVSRPKKLKRATASEASVPRTSATVVAIAADLERDEEGVAGAAVVDRLAEPLRRQPGGGHSSIAARLNA